MTSNSNDSPDLIDLYVNYASLSCDAPIIFHKAMSYFICSSLLGRFASVVTSYNPKGIKPNIWVILVGPSRIVRKTTSLSLAENIIREIDENLIIPASFTPEGLYDILNNMKKGDIGAWIKDEMGGFFRDLQRKKYMSGTREILSMIYSGRGEERKLRSFKLRIPWGIYITSAGTVPTPASFYFSEEDFTSGFLNRYLIAYALNRDRRIPLLHFDSSIVSLHEQIITTYKELVNDCLAHAPLIISFSSNAIKGLEDYDNYVERELQRLEKENPGTLWKMYLAETPNQLMKMTVLRRLARGDLNSNIIVVEEKDFLKAVNDLESFVKSANEITHEVQVSARPRQVETEERRLMRVYEIVKSSRNGVKWTELLMKTFLLKQDLLTIVETLMDQERIVAVRGESGIHGGRKAIIFTTKENLISSGLLNSGKLISSKDLRTFFK